MKFQLLPFLLLFSFAAGSQKQLHTDVLVIGGGTGGIAAGIQCARLGVRTIIAEPTPWIGGMISAAGVSAIDGNHNLPSGIWAEFRKELYTVYGGPKGVQTGWVSNTLFEPHVADSIFKQMAGREKNLSIRYRYLFDDVIKENKKIRAVRFTDLATGEKILITARIFIDATELGDVMKAAGIGYDTGLEAGEITGEKAGITRSENIVQDLTYVAILKDYGMGNDRTIPKPANYDPAEFDGCCTDYHFNKNRKAPTVDSKKMLDYGKLPNRKYMINWPIYGNDTYLHIVELSEEQRQQELLKAKETTLRFVYFIQHQLGWKHLGLADDEFPTGDKLALIPYHREGRRVKGIVRLTMRNIAEPFTYGDPLYRTGISVGDYPIDHHHKKNTEAPQHLEFYPVPSFNIPLGALIPADADNLIIAEKGISVSNVVNGTTRLQPCVMLTGQAAGCLAALSVQKNTSPHKVAIRNVQGQLLKAGAYIMPYIDVKPDHLQFEAVQKIGATGILKGEGIPFNWANQTWFYPDSLVNAKILSDDLKEFKNGNFLFSGEYVTLKEAITLASQLKPAWKSKFNSKKYQTAENLIEYRWHQWGFKNFDLKRNITRVELAALLHHTIDPFFMKAVNHKGEFIRNK